MNEIDKKHLAGGLVQFNGEIKDYVPGDSLRIMFVRRFVSFSSSALIEAPITHSLYFFVKVDKNGKFRFSVDSVYEIGALDLVVIRKGNWFQINDHVYYVEPGDDILLNIRVVKDVVLAEYFGKNSAKYSCMDLLFKDRNKFSSNCSDSYKPLWTCKDEEKLKYLNQFRNCCLQTLHTYKNKIKQFQFKVSPNAYRLMEDELDADANWLIIGAIGRFYFRSSNDHLKAEMYRFYIDSCQVNIDYAHAELLSISDVYFHYLFDKAAIEKGMELNRRASLTEVFDKINVEYSGLILDKLLGMLSLNVNVLGEYLTFNSDEIISSAARAEKIVKTDYIKQLLKRQLVMVNGSDAFDFSLLDTNGRLLRMSDFKGKFVLIDSWYTGCTGCAQFYRLFSDSLEPEFKKDTNFVTISICADNDKKTWMTSLYKDVYTNPRHINLFAGGFYESDYFKYYSPTTMPFIILIDKKGKIAGTINNMENADAMRNKIKAAFEN